MTDPEDALSAAEEKVLGYVLERALEADPAGVPATECDMALRGDAARVLHALTHKKGLLWFEAALYYPNLSAMRRRPIAFAEAIGPLQAVLDYGHRVLDDKASRNK